MTEPILLTIGDVLALTQIGRSRLYLEMGSGRLRVLRIGRAVRIHRDALEEWLALMADEESLSAPCSAYDPWGSPRR